MSYATCPDWPELMEIAPDLQFKHYTVRDAQLPAEALMQIPELNLDEVEICCDLERHVYFARHTDPRVVAGAARLALVRPRPSGRSPAPAAGPEPHARRQPRTATPSHHHG